MSGLIGTSSKTHLCPGLVLLPVSQVTAKYFLWVDDDFYFMNVTSIEKFVEIIESVPELDVVSF